MINCYVRKENRLTVVEGIDFLEDSENRKNVIWIDMFLPTIQEVKSIEKYFNIEFPTKQESEEIELSSRYWEEKDRIEINSYFLINDHKEPVNETVSFILQADLLISVRYKKLASFNASIKKLLASPREYRNGYSIFSQIIDIRIDADADIVEEISKDIGNVRKKAFAEEVDNEDILEQMSAFENLNMKIRENLTDKQRILNSLLKSQLFHEDKEDLRIMLKDIRSLIEHTNFNFERLDYLQNIFVGLLNAEQNKVIKIFTIVNVIFLPPTLVASIYGMNFEVMPELSWEYGYVFSFAVMILASIAPIIVFKKKGWI
ncbi:magnesium/cobalt transporter CorA [Arcobacter porcinus]|uniref:Magnesium transport protein CorA n=1 Tax=Arcobacter porcinus TaxID=1935204 RepID=A0ABX2YA86_9BACT|nr:magnesium/cobalt transporter CorA [Arcobacter porcinus]OCL81659.1 Magnesium transport protein CorA [Arcobacter porcinus]OCL82059.1 Magnesium transport protein CorA [Arcobacter porcinus]OCL86134.1 Magnesium transport protein CorA [Arcobacter porcinus]OCL90278.1 Magnesium transport protein CorA [Arcobacter porcinus]